MIARGGLFLDFKIHPFDTLGNYFSADSMALYQGRWIFCMHKERTTWEHPSGHVEHGETALEAAKRELYEETGAVDFDMEPICDYYIDAELNGYHYQGNGQVYFARVHTLGELPSYSEMGRVKLFDSLPENLTYPYFARFLWRRVRKAASIGIVINIYL